MSSDEQIRELAYAIWEQEGRPEGKHQEHYLRAKRILEERAITRAPGGEPVPPTPPATSPPGESGPTPPRARGRKPRSKKDQPSERAAKHRKRA